MKKEIERIPIRDIHDLISGLKELIHSFKCDYRSYGTKYFNVFKFSDKIYLEIVMNKFRKDKKYVDIYKEIDIRWSDGVIYRLKLEAVLSELNREDLYFYIDFFRKFT